MDGHSRVNAPVFRTFGSAKALISNGDDDSRWRPENSFFKSKQSEEHTHPTRFSIKSVSHRVLRSAFFKLSWILILAKIVKVVKVVPITANRGKPIVIKSGRFDCVDVKG